MCGLHNSVTFWSIRNEKKLNVVANLEEKILIWAETNLIHEALERRELIEMELRESVLWQIIRQKRENFNAYSQTVWDDAVVIIQLEMDAFVHFDEF